MIVRLFVSLVIVVSLAFSTIAQEEAVISPDLVEDLDGIEARVHEIRGLELTNEINRMFPTPEEVSAFIQESFREELPDDVVARETLFYRGFDFIPADFALLEVYGELLESQVAGFYDPETKNMNTLLISGETLGDVLPYLEKTIYAHEYAHALQDEYFDLSLFLEISEEPDEQIAALALVEGDATLVMQEYLTILAAEQPAALLALLGMSLSGVGEIPESVPQILENELTMPYLNGLEFATALRNEGGWEAINAAFDNPPVSSEQILHPQRYFDGDVPLEVTLADSAGVFDDGWELQMERTLGEFYLVEYLKTQLDNRTAERAGAGWGGDRFQLYYNVNADEIAWIAAFDWDTYDDMEEFGRTFANFASTRMQTDSPTINEGTVCWEDTSTQEALCLYDVEGLSLIASAPDVTLALDLINNQL